MNTLRTEQKIKVPVKCYGITLIDNDIVLGNEGVIYIINREGLINTACLHVKGIFESNSNLF
jgi:regulator of RNase E activity RraA